MHANLPEIAKRWERDYARGGIARLGFYNGNTVAPFPLPNDLGNPLNDYRVRGKEFESQIPMGTDTIGMNEMFSYAKPESIYAPYGMGPKGNPYQNPRTIGQQVYAASDPYGNKQMDLEKENFYQQPVWYNRMFNKARQGITGLKNKFTGAYDTSQNFVKNIMDNTMIGRVAAGFDATNPRAFNYNPALQGQLDFIKSQGKYGTNPTSGLNQITGGILAGKNLQSMFGSNDLGALYEKSIAQTEKTLAGLLEEDEEGNIGYAGNWSRLAKTNPAAFAKKVAIHKARLQDKQNEYNIFKAHQDKITQAKIAKEKAAARSFVQQNPNYGNQYDKSKDHSRGGGYGHTASSPGATTGSVARSRHARSSDLGFSDIRLKENVELIGNSPSNINIYKFNYLNDPTVYQGVMAQDVPWATVKADNGYLMVDYNKVDVEFKKWPK